MLNVRFRRFCPKSCLSGHDKLAALALRQIHWQQTRMSQPLQIIATDISYYHEADERAFFEWLDRMTFVDDYYGEVQDLFIKLNRRPTDDDMREIIGFCFRYGVGMVQLAKFETTENTAWFRDPTMFWYQEIFGHPG